MTEISQTNQVVAERDNTKLGIWLFLGGEIIFFATLILTYIMVRLIQPAAYLEFKSHLSIPLIGLNTFILISSSYMLVRGFEAIQDGNRKGLMSNLVAVLLLGALFLAGQAFEWTTLFREGEGISSTFGTTFFTVTGIHGSHVFVGLIWGLFILFSAKSGAYSEHDYHGVELFGLYWHFVDIVWIVLFTLFYLI